MAQGGGGALTELRGAGEDLEDAEDAHDAEEASLGRARDARLDPQDDDVPEVHPGRKERAEPVRVGVEEELGSEEERDAGVAVSTSWPARRAGVTNDLLWNTDLACCCLWRADATSSSSKFISSSHDPPAGITYAHSEGYCTNLNALRVLATVSSDAIFA